MSQVTKLISQFVLTGRSHMLFSISPATEMANHAALFCWRACHRPHTGFSFNTLSTSATQLLPIAIYYRQIERFQGVSQFVLAVIMQAWVLTYLLTYLRSFSPSLHVAGASARPPSGFVRAVVIVTKSSGRRKKRNCCFFFFSSKQRARMAVVPLVDPLGELSGGI